MPPEHNTHGEMRLYLIIDGNEIRLIPVWYSYKLLKRRKSRLCQILRFWRLRHKNYYPKTKFKQILLAGAKMRGND